MPFPSSDPIAPTISTETPHALWDYTPSLPAAAVGAGVFGLITFLHLLRLIQTRTLFCVPFVIGGLLETVGYAARAGARNDTDSLSLFITQTLLILLAPVFFTASIYALLSRLIQRLDGADLSLVHPSILGKVFIWADVLCFVLQGGGGGMLSQADSAGAVKMGNAVVITGLAVQMYVFCFFVRVATTFFREMRARPLAVARCRVVRWRRWEALLYVACACLGVRNAYRLVEYAMGKDGYLMVTEWPLYVGDFALMAILLVVCLAWYDPDIAASTTEKTEADFV